MSRRRTKPRVLLTGSTYRIVRQYGHSATVDKKDGHDSIGTPRWLVMSRESIATEARCILDQVAHALELREKRRRRKA